MRKKKSQCNIQLLNLCYLMPSAHTCIYLALSGYNKMSDKNGEVCLLNSSCQPLYVTVDPFNN